MTKTSPMQNVQAAIPANNSFPSLTQKKRLIEDHVNKFLLEVRLQNIGNKDVVYRFFPILLRTMLQHGSSLWKKLLSPVGEFLRPFFLKIQGTQNPNNFSLRPLKD
jgi:hypothetical protein